MSLFDSRFTKQPPVDSPDDSKLSESANLIFEVRFYCAHTDQFYSELDYKIPNMLIKLPHRDFLM